MREIVKCARALVEGVERRDFSFSIEDGKIVDDAATQSGSVASRQFGPEVIVAPGFINGHSHAYQILLRGWADDLPFERWRTDALYKVVPRLSPDDVYWTFVYAFDEMLRAGITTVAEFFYLNGGGNEHAEAAIRAARDTGIRLILARTWMDAQTAPAEFRESIDQAAARTKALIDAHPDVDVCVAPHSLHAASHEMIVAAAEFAREHDVMLHVHVAEAPYEGEQTRALHGASPIALLEKWGALNERLVAIHAIYATTEEKELLAERGARVVHNPTTNQYLGDGVCDVPSLQTLGVPIALGTDADVKPSLIDEMRAAALMQKVARLDGAALDAWAVFDFATAQGARALRSNAGRLSGGNDADYVVIDASHVDPWSPAVNAIVYRGEDNWIVQTFVGGRCVYSRDAEAQNRLLERSREAVGKIALRLRLGG
ncbi:MAG: amidohydrolase family protein [Candidatus Eremiobacteraeota bacterium]|nr:amidohydrolase family protein [Candidatus Eremiobacteraeota bacterium]